MNDNYIKLLNTLAYQFKDDKILINWRQNSETFFNTYMIISDNDYLIIGDKKTYKTYSYPKNNTSFKIKCTKPSINIVEPELLEHKDITILKIGRLKLSKKVIQKK